MSKLFLCEPITEKEANIFFKAALISRIFVQDFQFEGVTFYQMNEVGQMKFKNAKQQTGVLTGLRLLLCNDYLVIVNPKSLTDDQVEDPIKRYVFEPEWQKVKTKTNFIITPVDVLVKRKSASSN